MMEVLSESVRLVNLPFTVLLGCVVLYWLVMSLGLIDFETGVDVDLDVDADVDVDVDADVDADVDSEAEVEGGPGWFSPLFQFLNIGQVPMMIVLSIMILTSWTLSMALNHYWNNGSLLRAALLLIPNLAVTCVLTHFLTRPFKSLFKALNKEHEEHLPLVGRTCTITTSEANGEFGQAQIETKGAPIVINVRTTDGAVLKKGETGLVIKADTGKSICTILKVTTTKLEA